VKESKKKKNNEEKKKKLIIMMMEEQEKRHTFVGFEVLSAVAMKSSIFCNINKLFLLPVSCWFLAWLILLP
jgi:hypothetical protein